MSRGHRIADVAAAAGVSPTTVSHALSGKRAVSEATRARILQAIEELNYRPNLVARGLRKQQTHSIALLVADLANPYYPAVARSLSDGVTGSGYVTLIGNTDGTAHNERSLAREMLARGVDGLVMQPMSTTSEELRRIVGPSFPLVLLTDNDGPLVTDVVRTDDAVGIAEAVKHLAHSGVKDIAFVSGPDGRSPGTARLIAFHAAMAALDLQVRPEWVAHASFTRDGGFTAGAALLAAESRPRAVVAANDLIAIGVLDAARAAQLDVPRDLAVVGFDDIETADLVTPRLTTVRNPASLVGSTCAEALLRRIDGPDLPYRLSSLRTQLVLRASA